MKNYGAYGLSAASLSLVAAFIFAFAGFAAGAPAEGAIRGNVSFNGKPVKNALVLAISPAMNQKSVATDVAGNYLLSNLAAGNYLLTVLHSQYVVDDGEGVAGGYKLLEVANTASNEINFPLVRGGVIAGYVQDVSGQPVVRQQIFYEKKDSALSSFPLMSLRPEVFTDQQGYFRIYGLLPGKYAVGVGRDNNGDLGKLKSPFNLTLYPSGNGSAPAAGIDLAAGQEINLGKLEVRIREQVFSAQMQFTDQNGNSLPLFEFDLIQTDAAQGPRRTSFKTDETGSVTVRNLLPARYQVLPAVSNRPLVTASFSPVPFEVTDKDISGLVIRADSATVTIRGNVYIQGKGPASNLDCTLALKEGDDLLAQDKAIYQIKLNAEGKFQMTGLRKTIYTLVIMPGKPSLQYDSAQVDEQVFRGDSTWGQLRLDLRTSAKNIQVGLKTTTP